RRATRHGDRRRGGPADRGGGNRLHGHRAVLALALGRPADVDGERAGALHACLRRGGDRRPPDPRVGTARDGGARHGRPDDGAVTGLLLALVAAYGVHLV